MRRSSCALLLVTFLFIGCRNGATHVGDSATLTPIQATAVEKSVRQFAREVALGVTAEGPVAWGRYFENTPAFFMAVNGQIAFGSGADAIAGIPNVAKIYPHIELHWGDDLRVDPLTSALAVVAGSYHEVLTEGSGQRIDAHGFFSAVAEYRAGRWQFRNAHWSAPVAAK